MPDVRIDTPRGVRLAATLSLPTGQDPVPAELLQDVEGSYPERGTPVVVLAHDFLSDRHGLSDRLDRVAESYREAGLATLAFDFSGLGDSDDDVITLAGEVEDLHAVSNWLWERGFHRQAVHANGFGATATLKARPRVLRTVVAVGAVVGPQSILWEEVFSPEQLNELDRHGLTRVPDDNPNSRGWDVLSKETLVDVSMQEPEEVLSDLPWPVLLLHGALSTEFPGAAQAAERGAHLLPTGSRLRQVEGDSPEQALKQVSDLGVAWMLEHLA